MAHYVNNAEMLEAIKQYKADIVKALEEDTAGPRIPEYLGECMLKIATKLSHKPNFINYSYRDDMILDGIENCIQCINSFNPEKSSNPFAYFTQVIYFAFLRRIAKEKKQSYIKGRLIQDISIESYNTQEHDDDADFKNAYMSFIQANSKFDDSFIRNKEKRKKPKIEDNLEKFIDNDDENGDTNE